MARTAQEPLRIAVALDKAFGFYYPDDLAALRAAGAEMVPLDTLHDARLPPVDALLIGGGFPEVFMEGLEANAGLRADIAAAIAAGLPTYAECGGLMYLARSLSWKGRTCRMVGAIAGDATMHARPVGRGYVELQATDLHPWPAPARTSRCAATSSTTRAWTGSIRRRATPTASCAATASTAATTDSCRATCSPATPTCAAPAAPTGRRGSSPSCAPRGQRTRCIASGASRAGRL